jgi:hypothetical protein
MRHSFVLALMLAPAALLAQQAEHTISPGMTRAQVVAALGAPGVARTVSDFSYLFYTNACGKKCGMNDLVILHGDSVVDAIFRSPGRHYTGKSSSPAPVSSEAAREKSAAPAKPVRMKPSAPNDTKPSIPLKMPVIRPAPTTKPASNSK